MDLALCVSLDWAVAPFAMFIYSMDASRYVFERARARVGGSAHVWVNVCTFFSTAIIINNQMFKRTTQFSRFAEFNQLVTQTDRTRTVLNAVLSFLIIFRIYSKHMTINLPRHLQEYGSYCWFGFYSLSFASSLYIDAYMHSSWACYLHFNFPIIISLLQWMAHHFLCCVFFLFAHFQSNDKALLNNWMLLTE